MAQRQQTTKIDTRNARSKLKARNKPYFVQLDRELHLGYRKGKTGGSWVVRRYVGDGKYEIAKVGRADDKPDMVGALDFEEAKKQARSVAVNLRREELGMEPGESVKSGPYTLKDACRDYISQHVEKHSRAPEDIKRIINNDILPKLGRIEIAKLTKGRLDKWHQELAASPARLRSKVGAAVRHRDDDMESPEVRRRRQDTANRKLTTLKAVLNYAYNEKAGIDTDKAWKTVKPFRNVGRSRKRFLNDEEKDRLINTCDGALRNLVRAAIYTGCRVGELAAFKVGDFHRDAKGGTLYIDDSKTSETRHIHLNPEGVAFFDAMAAGRERDLPLLPTNDGERWGRSQYQRPFKAAVKRAGIEPFVFHSLRHTYASLSIMEGCSLIVLAEQLGHKDTRMVERHYGHLAKKYVREMIMRTSPTFGGEDTNVVSIGAGQ